MSDELLFLAPDEAAGGGAPPGVGVWSLKLPLWLLLTFVLRLDVGVGVDDLLPTRRLNRPPSFRENDDDFAVPDADAVDVWLWVDTVESLRAAGAGEGGTCGLVPRDGGSAVHERRSLPDPGALDPVPMEAFCSTSNPSLPRRKLRARL